MSKIIQITSAGNNGGIMLHALCEDGSLWEFCVQRGWIEMPLPTKKNIHKVTQADFYVTNQGNGKK